MKRSSKGSSEKSSNGDESPNHSDESESPQRLSQSGTPTLSTQMTAFQSDNNSSPSIEIIPSNEEQVVTPVIKIPSLAQSRPGLQG